MAESVFIRPSSTDDDHPMSLASSRSISTDSLVSSNASSDSDYRLCVDEMDSETSPSDEFPFDEVDIGEIADSSNTEMDEADLRESVTPIEAEIDDCPLPIPLYSIVASTPILSPSPLPPLPFIFPKTAD
ncbi:MAG: hypothetical protein GY847_37715, partial [Proteobacteria bacterium]|nr:hypothetical protein [Pseudomonadota bacterium]